MRERGRKSEMNQKLNGNYSEPKNKKYICSKISRVSVVVFFFVVLQRLFGSWDNLNSMLSMKVEHDHFEFHDTARISRSHTTSFFISPSAANRRKPGRPKSQSIYALYYGVRVSVCVCV